MEGKAPLFAPLSKREQEILAQLAAGLSDQEIADGLFLSLHTVKWYNRQIYNKLGVSSRTRAIAHAKTLGLFGEAVSELPSPPLPRYNLPVQSTPFIGRGRELDEVEKLFDRVRLLTLTGTGGIGKTRLALRVAEEIAETFANGVYFIDLAPLSDHTLVAKAIAKALGVFENPTEPLLDTLKRVLSGRETLLIIDNFEHLTPAARLVSELLAASPYLKVLVTSREALHIAGEQEYPVPPLSLPEDEAVSVETLAGSEAGALFVQRAQMTLPRFELRDDNASSIAKICTRLDGLPLAIELAAARSKLLTPRALLDLLEGTKNVSPLRTLTTGTRDAPARHRTLEDAIAWSYNLLDAHEKKLFARLAVFRGGHSLEAFEQVCGKGLKIDILDGLASLVDKSLVQQKETRGGEPRFVLLEMIHEYARERLKESGEFKTMQQRHCEYYVELAERAEPELRLARYGYWCQRFEHELDNIRAVLDWTLENREVSQGVRLASALGLFWYGRGYHLEGIRWHQRLLERLDEVPTIHHANFLISAGRLAWMIDLDEATQLFERALEVSRELGDPLQAAWALAFKGYAMQREPDTAMPVAEAGLKLFREMDHLPGIAQALNIIGELARMGGDDARAKRAYEECLVVCQQTGETLRTCYNLVNLAYVAQHEGEHERALSLVRQALLITRDTKDTRDIASFLVTFAGSIAALGQLDRAARLLGTSEAALERMGAFHQPTDKPEIDRITADVRAQLDKEIFQIAWAEGHEMSLDQAVANALMEDQ